MIAAGIAVALAAATANAFAVVLQASEARRSPLSQGAHPSLLVGLAHRPQWLAGTGLMIAAWPLQVLALALAPITVVQPVLASALVILLGVASVRLREHVGGRELVGALLIVAGMVGVVLAAPRHTVADASAVRLAIPMTVVGAGAVGAYALGRLRPRFWLAIVVGAGLAYAWADFANKLLSNDISSGHWPLAVIWVAATLCLGGLAFLEENTALQRRPAIAVAPVIAAIQAPLPVLMALWAGIEVWGAGAAAVGALIPGLTLVTTGAYLLGRSPAVAGVARVEPRAEDAYPPEASTTCGEVPGPAALSSSSQPRTSRRSAM